MEDVLAVRGGEPRTNLNGDAARLGLGQRPARANLARQRAAIEVLHRDEVDVTDGCRGRVDFEDPADVRMRDAQRVAGLGGEARGESRLRAFQRAAFAQFLVDRFVDDAHSAFGNLPHDAETAGDELVRLKRPNDIAAGGGHSRRIRRVVLHEAALNHNALPAGRASGNGEGQRRAASPAVDGERFTTVTATFDGYCLEWWTALCATTPFVSS